MAEALSIAASAVQFADLACRVARELYTFVSALKDASDELCRLNQTIKELAGILLDVQKLAEIYKNSALLLGNENTFDTPAWFSISILPIRLINIGTNQYWRVLASISDICNICRSS